MPIVFVVIFLSPSKIIMVTSFDGNFTIGSDCIVTMTI